MSGREESFAASYYRRMLAGVHATAPGETALESLEVEGPAGGS